MPLRNSVMVPGAYLCDPLRESIYRLYVNGVASHGYLLAMTNAIGFRVFVSLCPE